MQKIRQLLRNEYFPAALVLAGVTLFWVVALTGGLSLLHDRSLPIGTLIRVLFVYLLAVLSPVAAYLAVADVKRRYRRNRDLNTSPDKQPVSR